MPCLHPDAYSCWCLVILAAAWNPDGLEVLPGDLCSLCRVWCATEIGAMFGEIGAACCTLLYVLSLRASGTHSGLNASQLNSQIALRMTSLIVLCVSLGVMILGATRVLRVFHTVWSTVRYSMSGSTRSTGGNMFLGGVNQVVPVQNAGDEELLTHGACKDANQLELETERE